MGLFRLKLIMKIEICPYSVYKIYPGRCRTLIKQDGKTFKFLDSRSHKAHLLKRTPRKVTWTVLYRRKHRKGIEEEVSKTYEKNSKVSESCCWSHTSRHSRETKS